MAKSGQSPSDLAREFAWASTSIQNWVNRDQGQVRLPSAVSPLRLAEREELQGLHREIKQLNVKRDVLRKATAWFALKGEKLFTSFSNS